MLLELRSNHRRTDRSVCFVSSEEKYLSNEHDKKPIVIYSDGCTAQNRNCVLVNALLYLSEKRSIFITQKFLVKGHTKMECDHVHSTIEMALKNKEMYDPYDCYGYFASHPYLEKNQQQHFFKLRVQTTS